MKKTLLTLAIITLTITKSFAHYLWIETNPHGTVGQEQDIKVFFGEYTYGITEKVNGETFPNVKDFTLWVIDAQGNTLKLQTTAYNDYYLAKFTPTTNGTYTIALNNDNINVIDYTQYDFGIFKTHYHSVAKIQVGEHPNETTDFNKNGITIKDVSKNKDEVKLQVLFKNKPLTNNELKIFVADLWSKTLKTDEHGHVTFKLPWKTKYIIETTTKEEVPGTYKGVDYEFIWHCATYSIL
ncbi:DUF4198 domain-containing protein [Aestuariivivens insulae]|uniref:DUF4198 domain-containing protein n=1 Tax=Aestuariivivens insulae TaxID=1621988 RepID=UPI001F58D69C|nr:DUF4198 domain-containing protein [Aestuariivivens insulae]